jgi:L-ribulokinase
MNSNKIMSLNHHYVIGIDFGTDSVRALLVSANGDEQAVSVHKYRRWAEGKYCDSANNQFRQHPLDYLEGLEASVTTVLSEVSDEVRRNVKAISVDTTGSTPVAVDSAGRPLALTDSFEDNPNAMFILWKDHTAIQESEQITTMSKSWEGIDYTKYIGGIYSSEWFWAKLLHILRKDEKVRQAAYSWVEHCDWIPFELTGGTDVHKMKRSRCAAGHKAMWHEEFDGLPSENFLTTLDPLLSGLRERLYRQTYTADQPAGRISEKWANRLGLSREVVIGTGAFDAHMGAVGGQIEPYYLSKVMGTSTCDMVVAPPDQMKDKLIKGICGQVDGSVIPGLIGLEAGQSAFGDIYSWFKNILVQPVEKIIADSNLIQDEDVKTALIKEIKDKMFESLFEDAQSLEAGESGIIAVDWLNGRRTPDANQKLKTAIEGLDLGSDAPKIFRALVEASCFGAKAIVDRFTDEGVPIKGIIGLGGVSKKSPFVMQVLADVLDMPIKIVHSEQTCALGAGMFAATAAGIFDTVEEAITAMGSGFDRVYEPDAANARKYRVLYRRYRSLGEVIENRIEQM